MPARQDGKKKKKNDSLILSSLCRLYMFIRNTFSHSIFAMLMCTFAHCEKRFEKGYIAAFFKSSRISTFVKKYHRQFLRMYEQSNINKYIELEAHRILTRSSRDYGIFFAFSGVYIIVAFTVNKFVRTGVTADNEYLIASLIMFFISSLFIFSKSSLSAVICKNRVLRFFAFDIFGAEERVIYERETEISNPSIPLLLGMVFGIFCVMLSPMVLIEILLALLICLLTMIRPEVGTLAVMASLPLYGKGITVVYASVTFIAYLLKLLRNKRSFKFEFSDLFITVAAIYCMAVTFIPGAELPLSTFEILACLMLYFSTKNTICSWNAVKRSISVHAFIFFGMCAYYVLVSAVSGSAVASSVLPPALSTVFSNDGTVTMLIISLMPYMLISFRGAGRNRDRMALLTVILTGLYMVFSMYSYGAVACVVICFTFFMLTYSPNTFSAFTVLTFPVSVVIAFALSLAPGYSTEKFIHAAENSVFTDVLKAYGVFWIVLVVFASISFFGYMMSYTNEYYNEYTHKKRMSKMISAPLYSVLNLMICSVLVPGVDTFTAFVLFFTQTGIGMAMTAYAREQDGMEREWFTGGARK